jgi:hypothetical protein
LAVNPTTVRGLPELIYFKPSGGVRWGSFVAWLLIPLSLAAVLAAVMFWLFDAGHYYIIIVPAIAALAVVACLKLAVNKGHCRSRVVAGAAGFCTGIILYLGYYYCGMVYQLGPEVAGHPELLPKYIRFRLRHDAVRDIHDSRPDEASRPSDRFMNWGVFASELAIVLAFTVGGAVGRARKPYCEPCQKWMLREVTHFNPAKANELRDAFLNRSARSLAVLAAEPVFATIPSTILALDCCPSLKEGSARDCSSYVSLKNVTRVGAGGGPVLDPFDSAKGKVLLRSLALSADEAAALAGRFEVLGRVAGRAAVEALASQSRQESPSLETAALPIAEIRPVESDFAGKVLTKRTAWVGAAWAFAALLFLFAGIGLMAWGGLTAFPDSKSNQAVSADTKALGITGLIVGGLLFGGTALFFLVNPTYLGNRYLLKVVRREFARRTGCLVQPNDPEALFVEVVPKLNWGKMVLESATDVGFLHVDKRRREVLFEGDKERWRIPAAAILSSEVEFFVEGQGTHAARKVFYAVLRARRPGQFWEAPLRERTGAGIFRTGRRKQAAERLCASIREL